METLELIPAPGYTLYGGSTISIARKPTEHRLYWACNARRERDGRFGQVVFVQDHTGTAVVLDVDAYEGRGTLNEVEDEHGKKQVWLAVHHQGRAYIVRMP